MTVKPGWARKRDRLRHREAAKPAWRLSAADWRTLIITFVGGVGSIVAAAGVIGGAIAIARAVRNEGLQIWVTDAVLWLIGVPFGLILLRLALRDQFSGSDRALRVVRVIMWIFYAIWGVTVALISLVWIGVAAGIK